VLYLGSNALRRAEEGTIKVKLIVNDCKLL
jgi:hypothetical protein